MRMEQEDKRELQQFVYTCAPAALYLLDRAREWYWGCGYAAYDFRYFTEVMEYIAPGWLAARILMKYVYVLYYRKDEGYLRGRLSRWG
jgi:hypothetical protein